MIGCQERVVVFTNTFIYCFIFSESLVKFIRLNNTKVTNVSIRLFKVFAISILFSTFFSILAAKPYVLHKRVSNSTNFFSLSVMKSKAWRLLHTKWFTILEDHWSIVQLSYLLGFRYRIMQELPSAMLESLCLTYCVITLV